MLEQNGFARNEVILAWDFTIGSQSSITSKLLFIRDDGMQRVEAAGGVQWGIRNIQDDYNDNIARHIEAQVLSVMYLRLCAPGTYSPPLTGLQVLVPQYVDRPYPGAHLVLDESGTPVFQGWHMVDVTILVPYSLANGSIPASQGKGR